ncbi:MAG: hypothetical protein PUC32_03560 [Oscillospiraceae bacterium]|nr:hypothetical protein [Oscillospiraceae bacterium]
MKPEELYTFSVVLCDNEVDRDYERFTVDALKKLQQLFLGKTGIFDHSPKAEHQSARIYDTYLETDPSRRTEDGETYTRLVAKAYLPRSEKNSQFILEIDSGMKKEVSVGCAVAKRVCSICGSDRTKQGCDHRKGVVYNIHGTQKCAHDILSDPTDAYEWSFVAVPSQRRAGVIKAFALTETGEPSLEKLFSLDKGEVVLEKTAALQLRSHIAALEQQAQSGKRYREHLAQEVQKLSRMVQPEMPASVVMHMTESASLEDLEALQMSFYKQAQSLLPLRPQLWQETPEHTVNDQNQNFKI